MSTIFENNIIFDLIWTFAWGCFGAGIFLYITNIFIPSVKNEHFFENPLTQRSQIFHMIIGGMISMAISLSHKPAPLYQVVSCLLEGAAWPGIFLGIIENLRIRTTIGRLREAGDVLDALDRDDID